jgi:hypothetical protein
VPFELAHEIVLVQRRSYEHDFSVWFQCDIRPL